MHLLSYGVAVTVGSLQNVRVKPLRAAFIGGDVISQMDEGARAGLKLSRLRGRIYDVRSHKDNARCSAHPLTAMCASFYV